MFLHLQCSYKHLNILIELERGPKAACVVQRNGRVLTGVLEELASGVQGKILQIENGHI